MAVLTKDQRKANIISTLTDGGELSAAEDRALRTNEIDSSEDYIQSYTTVDRDKLTEVPERRVIYNTDKKRYEFFNGTSWQDSSPPQNLDTDTSPLFEGIYLNGKKIFHSIKLSRTTSGSPEAVFSMVIPENGVVSIKAIIVAGKTDFTKQAHYEIAGLFNKKGGASVGLVGQYSSGAIESDSTWQCSFGSTETQATINACGGAGGETVDWRVYAIISYL